ALVPALLVVVLAGLRLSLHRPLAMWLIRRLPARLRSACTEIYDHYASFGEARALIGWHFVPCLIEQIVQVGMWLVAALAIGVETPVLPLCVALSLAQCSRALANSVAGGLFGEFTMVRICSMFGGPP